MTALADIIRPGATRGLDFVVLDELRKRTGINPNHVLKFALAEMLCNALDKDSTQISVVVTTEGEFFVLSISDNGSKKLSLEDIQLILNFENKASSKRGLLRVSRGYLGNALKCIFGYSYALAENAGLTPQHITVESGEFAYKINLKPDRISEVIKSEIETVKRADDGLSVFTVRFPKHEDLNLSHLKDIILATSMVNPTRRITYDLFGERAALGFAENNKTIRQETSVLWYTQKQFTVLLEDFIRARPETQLKDFIALFRGFTAKKVIREILQNLNASNHDSEANSIVQFFPATPLKELPTSAFGRLYTLMKSYSKPITKRSIPTVLTLVGKESFERICKQNVWSSLKYVALSHVKVNCPMAFNDNNSKEGCRNPDHVEFPYLIEVAVFDRQDSEGMKVYQCVNFMASMEDLFSRIYNVNYHLGRVGIQAEHSVTVVVHMVCPVLKWLNYGKSGLDE